MNSWYPSRYTRFPIGTGSYGLVNCAVKGIENTASGGIGQKPGNFIFSGEVCTVVCMMTRKIVVVQTCAYTPGPQAATSASLARPSSTIFSSVSCCRFWASCGLFTGLCVGNWGM